MGSSEEQSDYESLREKNINEIRKLLGFDFNPHAISSNQNIDFDVSTPKRAHVGAQHRKKQIDKTFKPRETYFPEERRMSLRIAKMEPIDCYKESDFEDDSDKDIDDDLEGYVKSLQKVVYPRRRSSRSENVPVVDGFRVKEFTQKEIDNIARFARDKKKMPGLGSTCHQCRQHSSDTKSFCHNTKCTNINGQLCGPCLYVRYGEDLETVLKDPKWICPYCRGICNCSFCRRRTGRLPTGILAHVASKQGYKSVHHLLSLSRNDNESDNDKENQNADEDGEQIKQERTSTVQTLKDDVLYGKENCILDFREGNSEMEKMKNTFLKSMDANLNNENEEKERMLYIMNDESVSTFSKTGECLLGFDEDFKPVTRILA